MKQRRLAKTASIPCVVRESGIAEEDSPAENIQRAPRRPLDQFRAFATLREKGQSEEEIAAAFFVTSRVVRQRLKLASVSPKLLDAYAEGELTLDQLVAFTVNSDHERQEQAFERVRKSHSIEPYAIRRMLTERAVRATNKRAQFIGVAAYVEAGGAVLSDLFNSDEGGWLQDVALVNRLIADKLEREADLIRADPQTQPIASASAESEADLVAAKSPDREESEAEYVLKPIPDRLMTELTAWRTLALRGSIGDHPDVAFLAALHALCLRAFYRYSADSCLDLEMRSFALGTLGGYRFSDTELVQKLDERPKRWAARLPKEPQDLWAALVGFDLDSRQALFAHCVSLSVNAVFEPYNRRPRALALAALVDLDMTKSGWRPTVETYLGRVAKARILAAVREARGDDAARRLEDMKKGEMAETAEGLLADTGWLPEPLRRPGRAVAVTPAAPTAPDADPTAADAKASEHGGDADPEDLEHGDDDAEPDAEKEPADRSRPPHEADDVKRQLLSADEPLTLAAAE